MSNISSLVCLFISFPLLAWCQLTDTTRVAIHDIGDQYEIENGYLGVRVNKASLFDPELPLFVPAPIRSVVYRDGTLSNNKNSYLTSTVPPLTMSDSILYETADSCAILIRYTFLKPELYSNSGQYLEDAGPGYYRVTLRMVKGEKACIVTEESDFEVGYEFKVSDGLSPDKGRYQGRRATSVQDGYDINGDVYDKGNGTGWNATVDLQFDQRKEFDLLARWNPYVVNTGWHWQLYNDTATIDANIFGIFDGKPSLLLGTLVSGAGIYTESAAISNMHAACDTSGNCHYVWLSEDELLYKKIDSTGFAGPETLVASGVVNPFVFLNDTVVNILAIDPFVDTSDWVKMYKKAGSGNFQTHTLQFDANPDDYFIYGASNGLYDFVMFKGDRDDKSGLLLYGTDGDSTDFEYKDIRENISAHRSANRPDMRPVANGDILVVHTGGSSYQSYNLILKDSTHFDTVAQLPFGTDYVTLGMAADPYTGDFFFVTSNNEVVHVDLDGSAIDSLYFSAINAKTYGFGFNDPNRRSVATRPDSTKLAFSEGEFYWYKADTTNQWVKLTAQVWQEITDPHVHYNPTLDSFYIVGKYQGKLARFRFGGGTGAPILVEHFSSTENRTAGVRVTHSRLASPFYYPDIRFQWCIFADTKGPNGLSFPEADVVQPIAITMNRLSGLASKLEGYQYDPVNFDPNFEEGGIYMTAAALATNIEKIKMDEAFYDEMVDIDPSFKDVMDAWRDETGTLATQVYHEIRDYAEGLKEGLTTGDGIYSYIHHYTLGSNDMQRYTVKIAGLLADEGKLSPVQRDTLLGISSLFARILWDDDFVPFFLEHGLGFGTGSQGASYAARRWFFALIASGSPEFEDRAAEVPGFLQSGLDQYVTDRGVAKGTPHYISPSMDQYVLTALQLKTSGIIDKFQTSDTLKLFADFLLHLRTPESVRFSNQRKLISLGDGSEESAALFGLLATGFDGLDDLLSKRLMKAYRNGPPRRSDFGFVTMAVDHGLQDTSLLQIGSGHFPGYLSTVRSGLGTEDESAFWFINGDWYSDHRNDDEGQVAMYALGAPLSLNFGSLYSPHMPGAHFKGIPVPEAQFPQWNEPNQPFSLNDEIWGSSQHKTYLAFENSGFSKATYFKNTKNWTREVAQFHGHLQAPIFIVRDELSDSSALYVSGFNFMAQGSVDTPDGPVVPPAKKWDPSLGSYQSPEASVEIDLTGAGISQFRFTGTEWIAHPAGGIDIDVFLLSDQDSAATLSEYAHTFIPPQELEEFKMTNDTNAFEERQIMLRMLGKKGFYSVILPHPKGQPLAGLSVTTNVDTVFISCDSFEFETDLNYAIFDNGTRQVLTVHTSTDSLTYAGATIEDGPMELEIKADTIFARLHGPTGTRTVTLPAGNWTPNRLSPGASLSNGKWLLEHTFSDSLHNSFSGGYTEYIFVEAVKVSPRIFLQGPYNPGTQLMGDNLRSGGHLPLTEPYSALGFAQHGSGGGEKTWPGIFDTTGANAIVDWVFLELRDKNDPSVKVATRAALVQRDGDVRDLDGRSPVDFHGVPDDDYYLAVRHRNHLGVRTNSVISLSGANSNNDLTEDLSIIYKPLNHPNEAMADLGGGVYGLWGGNSNGDAFVRKTGSASNNDYSLLLNAIGGTSGLFGVYRREDFNMDANVRKTGSATVNDYSKLLSFLLGSSIIYQALD